MYRDNSLKQGIYFIICTLRLLYSIYFLCVVVSSAKKFQMELISHFQHFTTTCTSVGRFSLNLCVVFFFRFFFPEIQNENFHLIDLICTNCYNYLFNTNQFYMVEKLRKYWKFLICNKVDRIQIILKKTYQVTTTCIKNTCKNK